VKQLKISVQIVDGPFHPVLARFPVLLALFLGIFGTYLSLSLTSMSSKYTIIVCIGLIGLAALVYFHRYLTQLSLFAFVIATGIGAQYRFLTQNDQFYEGFNHHGGALPEPVLGLVDIPILCIIGIALFRFIILRMPLPKWTGLDTCIVLFLAACGISFFYAPDLPLAFYELLRYGKFTLLYVALRILFEKQRYGKLLFIAWIFALAFEGIIAFAQYFFDFHAPFYINGGVVGVNQETTSGGFDFARVTGMIGGCNSFASWLLFPLCIMITGLFITIKKQYKKAILSLFVLGLIALILTFSRAGWISIFVCCTAFLSVVVLRGKLKPLHIKAILFFVAISIIAAQVSGIAPYIVARVTTDDSGAMGIRPELNKIVLRMLNDVPFTGLGLNNFQKVVHPYDPEQLTLFFDSVPHNIYMLFASETGIFGMLFLISIGVYLFSRSISILKKPRDEYSFFIATASVAYLLGIMVNDLADNTLRNELVMSQCTLMAGLIMSVKPIMPHPEKTM
jgi:O-antigen ligase